MMLAVSDARSHALSSEVPTGWCDQYGSVATEHLWTAAEYRHFDRISVLSFAMPP